MKTTGRLTYRLLLAGLLFVLLVGCASPRRSTDPAALPVTPGAAVVGDPARGWQVVSPADQGVDPARLEAMRESVRQQQLDLDSLLIVYRGAIVFEEYYGGEQVDSLHELYSVTKSFTSTLAGLAIEQGHLGGVDARVVDLLPAEQTAGLDPDLESMTVEDLLSMRSGLDWREGDAAYRALYQSRDWVREVLSLPPVYAPGEHFNYCSGCSHVLMAVIQEQVGMNAERYARENLLEPLGITRYRWETDARGIPIGGWGLGLTARDMAKFGYLYLHEGQWGGEQLVPREWVKAATARQADADGRLDYGYQWWIDTEHAAFAALGRDGQMIYVDPAYDLIVVTTARMRGGHDPLLDLVDEYIRPAVSD